MDALPEMEQGRVIASLAFVQEPADEAVVAALLHDLQSNHLAIPVFVITSEDDVYQRLRFFEWGAVDCLAWPVDLSRLAALIDAGGCRRRFALPSARRPPPPSRFRT
jgi:FixJ family two-component response regulator